MVAAATIIGVLAIAVIILSCVVYKQDLKICELKSRLWDMGGLEPVFWYDDVEG